MTGFLLVVILALPGQPPIRTEIGVIFDAQICGIVGAALAGSLQIQRPGARARWDCVAVVSA